MPLSCLIARHRAAPGHVHNQGFDFGACARCGRDMVRSGRAWRGVPAGFRVVWRPAPAGRRGPRGRQLLFDLPCAGRALTLSDTPSRRGRLALAGELFSLAARSLAWALLARIRRWGRAMMAPRNAWSTIPRLAPPRTFAAN